MKKGILIFLSVLLFISISAQENKNHSTRPEGLKEGQSNFRGGVRIGFTGSQITKDGFAFEGFNKFGAFVGAFVNFPVTKSGKWLIQPELNFIMKGCKHTLKFDENGNITGPNMEDYKLQLMYGEIPVLVKWRFFRGFQLELGPAFGILIKNIDVEKVNGDPNYGAPPFARFSLSGIIGIEYLFFNHLGVNLRFEGSLLPVRKTGASQWMYLLGGQYNQSFCFSVYYQF
ncbi:MAG: PorT family protein [Lentimicrobiaceae bacterium]|nr:PorT family protein [Lentimicrobiaceae bacterium]